MSEQPEAIATAESEKRKLVIISELENSQGENPNIEVEVGPQGEPNAVYFYDIDKTLARLKEVYRLFMPKLFPEEPDADKLLDVHEKGFRLGTMWRELYRLHGIYKQGKTDWIDPEKYENDFIKQHEAEIDNPGNPYFELADKMLQEFDEVASATVEEEYRTNPQIFDKAKINPIYHLAEMNKRLKVPQVAMTANPKRFARSICKYMGLSEYFIDCATDTDVPGLKERKMEHLIAKLRHKGINTPYDRLVIVGDSISGDLGSGNRLKELLETQGYQGPVDVKGLLVLENEAALEEARNKIAGDPALESQFRTGNFQAVRVDRIKFEDSAATNIQNNYFERLAEKPRIKFTKKINTTVWRYFLPLHKIVSGRYFLPFHYVLRDVLLRFKIIKHEARQDYLLGWLHPDRKIEDFILHLKLQGFDDQHFASWVDKGELIDLRLLESFDFQYHIRIFHDREVRGHYEVTAESRPIAHLRDTYTERRSEQFLGWIGDWIIRDKQQFAETQYPTERRRHRVAHPSWDNDADL